MSEIAIVGGGAVGLTLAGRLAQHGASVTVFEAEPAHARIGSRAICMQRETLEIWQRLGIGETVARRGIQWRVGRTYHRGRLLFEGLKERYIIPADAVLDCRVEPMMPHTGNWNFFAVVLTVRYPMGVPASVTGGRRDDEWEVPFLPRPTRFRRYNTAYRRALARDLRDEIEDMLDQAPRRKSS